MFKGLTEGRVVHFVLSGQTRSPGEHRPAIVVKVWRDANGEPQDNGVVNLQVLLDNSNDGDVGAGYGAAMAWKTSVLYDEGGKPDTWHWVEPV